MIRPRNITSVLFILALIIGISSSFQAPTRLSAGQDISLTKSQISVQSEGLGNAGDIQLTAVDTVLLDGATVTSEAAQASGGNIKLTAEELISLNDSIIESSVQGDENTQGGDISLDPKFIILQNSQILAKAVEGQGGNISLIASQAVLVDSFSVLDASSALGVSGSVNIQAPTKFLSGAIVPLEHQPVNVAALYGARCAAGAGGHFSTFVDSKTDSLAPTPGTFLASPLLLPSTRAVADTSAASSGPVVLTASIAPLVLGHAGEPTSACP
jgi:large exoprotein involved in heme utilization and adhesion